jgi:SAM-dependent methyltransferase
MLHGIGSSREPPSADWPSEYYKPDISSVVAAGTGGGGEQLNGQTVSRVTAGASFYRIIRTIFGRQPASLLDIGCGNGAVVHAAASDGVNAVGVDSSEYAINLARNVPGEFICADFRDFDVAPGPYEVVVMLDVVEHFADPVAVLEVIIRRVARDGKLIVTTTNVDGWLRREQGWAYHHYSDDHEVLFSAKSLHALLARCGATEVRIADLGDYLQEIGGPRDEYAIMKYTRYRSHLLAVASFLPGLAYESRPPSGHRVENIAERPAPALP